MRNRAAMQPTGWSTSRPLNPRFARRRWKPIWCICGGRGFPNPTRLPVSWARSGDTSMPRDSVIAWLPCPGGGAPTDFCTSMVWLGRASANRLRQFLKSCQSRQLLWSIHDSLVGGAPRTADIHSDDDRPLLLALNTHHRASRLFARVGHELALRGLDRLVLAGLDDPAQMSGVIEGLRTSAGRATSIRHLESAMRATRMFRESWLNRVHEQLCQGRKAINALTELQDEFDDCEAIVRIQETVSGLPTPLATITRHLLSSTLAAPDNLAVLDKLIWECEIKSQLAEVPTLARIDGARLTSHLARFQELRDAKLELVRTAILHRWTQQQQQRLLVSTRSRLNGEGSEIRRRLTMQGTRALRLRKVIAIGTDMPGGDPLFDLRPVWMAGPDSVAQIFPRLPLFDVIIFDEASQCRLEEALPVLTRGRRVVIAGDTKQLPPTRFFESSVITSQDEEGETEQDWFEIQQGEVEDLLSGALNLQIEQCYLDVHYRSSNADLIQFSNKQFYASRLQPIPGHPRNRAALSADHTAACRGSLRGAHESRGSTGSMPHRPRLVATRRASVDRRGVLQYRSARLDR